MLSIPLFLSDVAGSEVIVIVLVVLLFFGSKSVPGIAKSLGQAIYQIRNASNDLQQEIRKSGEEMKKDLELKTGLHINRFEIGKIDYLNDTCLIRIFYFADDQDFSNYGAG